MFVDERELRLSSDRNEEKREMRRNKLLNCSYFEHTLYIFLLERALFTRHPLLGSRKEHALPFLPFIPRWILFGRNYEEYFEYALKGTPKGVFDQLPPAL